MNQRLLILIILKYLLGITVIIMFIPFMNCSLPSNVEPVRWDINMTIPLMQDEINFRENIAKMDFEGMEFIDGDTLSLKYVDSINQSIEMGDLITFTNFKIERKIGAIELQNTKLIDKLLAHPINGPIPENIPFTNNVNVDIPLIQSVIFDESCPNLNLFLKNTSANASLSDVIVSLYSGNKIFGIDTITSLPATITKSIELTAADKRLGDSVNISISGIINGGNGISVTSGEGINIQFNLDGMVASQAEAIDSILSFSKQYEQYSHFGDTIQLKYLDLDTMEILTKIKNPVGIQLGVIGEISNIWDHEYSQTQGINSQEILMQLANKDSINNYRGIIFDDTFSVIPNTKFEKQTSGLKKIRLFPTWDDQIKKSQFKWLYNTKLIPDGRSITFNKNDSIVFEIILNSYTYMALSGKFIKDNIWNLDGNQMAIPSICSNAITDSLKGKFSFFKSNLAIDMEMLLPKPSFIDSANLNLSIINYNYKSNDTINENSVKLDTLLTPVVSDQEINLSIDVSKLVNNFADSLTFGSSVKIPAGTNIVICNDTDSFGNYSNKLSLPIKNHLTYTLPFIWEVSDTIKTGHTTHEIELIDNLTNLNKIENLSVTCQYTILNNSLLHVQLYGIAATKEHKKELYDLDNTEINPQIFLNEKGKNFIDLFGSNGMTIPSNGDTISQKIILNEQATSQLSNTDSLFIRYYLLLPKVPANALLKSSSLNIHSSLNVKGIGRSDSLITQ